MTVGNAIENGASGIIAMGRTCFRAATLPTPCRPDIRTIMAGRGASIAALGRSAAVLGLMIAAPATAWAWGAPGCADLPEYNRALGALQGMTSACGMSVEEARRVVAARDGPPAAERPGAAGTPGLRPAPAAPRETRRRGLDAAPAAR